MGLGVIGSAVARVLLEKGEVFSKQLGAPVVLSRVLERDLAKADALSLDRAIVTTDGEDFFAGLEADIVIELLGGEKPAYDYMKWALQSGRYVATANKEVMAKHGPELLALAREKGVDILYEASVGGGIPIIAPLKRDLLANEITAISAIINGTTNYILTSMSKEGRDFGEALQRAQSLGYAEADPTNDVEGIDAAYKLSILSSLAFRTTVTPDQVYREGITKLSAKDFRYAREMGYAIKLLAVGKREGASIQVRVHPVLLAETEPLAMVDGVLNAIQVEGDLIKRVMFEGPGAGPQPTSSAVVSDVLNAAHALAHGGLEPIRWSAGNPPFAATDGGAAHPLLHAHDGGRQAGRAGPDREHPRQERHKHRHRPPEGSRRGDADGGDRHHDSCGAREGRPGLVAGSGGPGGRRPDRQLHQNRRIGGTADVSRGTGD